MLVVLDELVEIVTFLNPKVLSVRPAQGLIVSHAPQDSVIVECGKSPGTLSNLPSSPDHGVGGIGKFCWVIHPAGEIDKLDRQSFFEDLLYICLIPRRV